MANSESMAEAPDLLANPAFRGATDRDVATRPPGRKVLVFAIAEADGGAHGAHGFVEVKLDVCRRRLENLAAGRGGSSQYGMSMDIRR